MLASVAPGRCVSEIELADALVPALEGLPLRQRRVLVVVPDDTRTLPMPILFRICCSTLLPRVRSLSFLVALGTHPPMDGASLGRHLGYDGTAPTGVMIQQHEWQNQRALTQVGALSREEVRHLSQGLIDEEVPLQVHRAVLENDLLILMGPVYPHELVGFSGGHKYLFPGVSGPAMLHQTHWLGALITNPKVNGYRETPPRRMIEAASMLVPTERVGISLVMKGQDLHGIFIGEVRAAWEAAVELSSRTNIAWIDRAFSTVIACAPRMYKDLWTGSKCMTKLEPVVADRGTLVLYAPHISRPSLSHGDWYQKIGYHVRDYVLAHRQLLTDVPLAVLADLIQLPGIGTFRCGIERTRISVRLATAIPEEECRKINLSWEDPHVLAAKLAGLESRKEEGVLVVRDAGEVLYRLADGKVPDVDAL
jgi:nickel-dependent lactate racemase